MWVALGLLTCAFAEAFWQRHQAELRSLRTDLESQQTEIDEKGETWILRPSHAW